MFVKHYFMIIVNFFMKSNFNGKTAKKTGTHRSGCL